MKIINIFLVFFLIQSIALGQNADFFNFIPRNKTGLKALASDENMNRLKEYIVDKRFVLISSISHRINYVRNVSNNSDRSVSNTRGVTLSDDNNLLFQVFPAEKKISVVNTGENSIWKGIELYVDKDSTVFAIFENPLLLRLSLPILNYDDYITTANYYGKGLNSLIWDWNLTGPDSLYDKLPSFLFKQKKIVYFIKMKFYYGSLSSAPKNDKDVDDLKYNYLIPEEYIDDFAKKLEKENSIAEEIIKKQEAQRKTEDEEKEKNRKKEYELWGSKTYGKNWAYIKQKKVLIGWTKELCKVSLGDDPARTYKQISGTDLIEIWEYDYTFRDATMQLFFKNGTLYRIVNPNFK